MGKFRTKFNQHFESPNGRRYITHVPVSLLFHKDMSEVKLCEIALTSIYYRSYKHMCVTVHSINWTIIITIIEIYESYYTNIIDILQLYKQDNI